MNLDAFFTAPQYGRPQPDKERLLLPLLNNLTEFHRQHCPAYARILQHLNLPERPASLADLPYIPASLFKTHTLHSVADSDIRSHLTSSGTTGQNPSRIAIDAETATLQARAFAAVLRGALGPDRLPMLLIESESTLNNRAAFSARAVGTLGMMAFGRAPVFALDDNFELRAAIIDDFLARHGKTPFVIFGFTSVVWQSLKAARLDFANGILIHGGGWKKLADQAVDNANFRATLAKSCNLKNIYNYYGMIEQTGNVFLEGGDGCVYPPAFGDILIRDPHSWEILPPGKPGVVQVLSLLPRSYPGHSLLSEDIGMIVSVDAGHGGRLGKAVKILGRAPRAELRGCSDVPPARMQS